MIFDRNIRHLLILFSIGLGVGCAYGGTSRTEMVLDGDFPAPDIELPSNPLVFPDAFDAEVGLWKQNRAGHTRPVAKLKATHSGRVAANRLFVAAYLDALDTAQATQILRALRGMQVLDGSARHGCMKTYYEEEAPVDTNASFFIGLQLLALDRTAKKRLTPEGQEILQAILEDLAIWFRHEAEDGARYYPNKYMGDLVCAWLFQEAVCTDCPEAYKLADTMREAAKYWQEQHWGWGEHMSDNYAPLLVSQISTLLLFQRELPKDVYAEYKALFAELNAIAYRYQDGPRVPVIRSYFGTRKPDLPQYHEYVKPLQAQSKENIASLLRGNERIAQGDLFYRLGWFDMVNAPEDGQAFFEIPCYGDSVARAWVSPTARLGTMSRYPIMPNTDQMGWGLSWQTMPVAFATAGDGWGFLRWESREGDVERAHPADSHKSGYLDTTLTRTVNPPIVGETYSLQEGPDALVVRVMPRIAASWDALVDTLVFNGTDFAVVKNEPGEKVSRLLINAAGEILTVFYLPLGHSEMPQLKRGEGRFEWRVEWDKSVLEKSASIAGAWIMCWGRDLETPPAPIRKKLQDIPGEVVWEIQWPLPGGYESVTFSQQDNEPLKREHRKND